MADVNAERVLKRIVLNPRCSTAARLRALRCLPNSSYRFLEALTEDPKTPGRLASLAAEMYLQRVAAGQKDRTYGKDA